MFDAGIEKKPIALDFAAVAALKQARASRAAPPVDADWNHFEFSRCYTDWKSGKKIHSRWRNIGYISDQPYRDACLHMLATLGVPEPSDIHHGAFHDLVFIKSHGVVLRIGPANIAQTLNPGMLQPLGWLQDDSLALGTHSAFSVVVMPGIDVSFWLRLKYLRSVINACENSDTDVNFKNVGLVQQGDAALTLLIDVDSEKNAAFHPSRRYHEITQVGIAAQLAGLGIEDVMGASLHTIFNGRAPQCYMDAHHGHDGLRRLFWDAFGSPHIEACRPEPKARAAFWSACRRATLGTVTLPATRWRNLGRTDNSDVLTCQEDVSRVRLHTPWVEHWLQRSVRQFLRPG